MCLRILKYVSWNIFVFLFRNHGMCDTRPYLFWTVPHILWPNVDEKLNVSFPLINSRTFLLQMFCGTIVCRRSFFSLSNHFLSNSHLENFPRGRRNSWSFPSDFPIPKEYENLIPSVLCAPTYVFPCRGGSKCEYVYPSRKCKFWMQYGRLLSFHKIISTLDWSEFKV